MMLGYLLQNCSEQDGGLTIVNQSASCFIFVCENIGKIFTYTNELLHASVSVLVVWYKLVKTSCNDVRS
jgi:hypothetical protein